MCGQINISENFSAVDALSFGNKTQYSTIDFIEDMYEMEDSDALFLQMKNETTGFGTRKSGVQIRTKILNLLNAKKAYPLIIDWSGVPVISSSFADEMMGKLFIEMGALTFSARIKNKGMEELILKLLDKAIAQRLTQEKDEEN